MFRTMRDRVNINNNIVGKTNKIIINWHDYLELMVLSIRKLKKNVLVRFLSVQRVSSRYIIYLKGNRILNE